MTRDLVNRFAATLPGAEVSDPWGGGHDAWKVGDKLFAVIGALDQGVTVKCPDVESAALLIESGRGERAPYFHASWVLIPWDRMEDAELCERIGQSYRLIRDKLPRKVRAALPAAS